MCCVLHRMWDIKAILLYASVAENEFFTRTRSLKARKAARSCTNTYTLERNANTHTHTSMQDLPRHQHSDPRLSVSFQSQTRWMAGEWKSWLKPNPIPLLPSTVRERPSILRPPLCRERATSPALFHTSFSRIILLRVFTLPKIQIYIWNIYFCYLYILYLRYIQLFIIISW